MRPLYIVGTQRHVGKTTLSLGLLHAFRRRGLSVAYMKPLGQRAKGDDEAVLHDDTKVIARFLGAADIRWMEMAVPLPSGRVERDIHSPGNSELLEKIVSDYESLAAEHDLVLIEAMGHVAMGSCLGLSAADVSRTLDARTLLVSGAGIGRTIDEVSLCGTFIEARGADFMGVVVNKIFMDKYTRIKRAVTLGLEHLGIKSYGAMPFQEELACPTMRHVLDHLRGEVLGGDEHMDHRVARRIVGAAAVDHMARYIVSRTLVITPGDRTDTILACLAAHADSGSRQASPVSGLVLTCGYSPDPATLAKIAESHLPTILVPQDTYTVASGLKQKVFKITPDDRERIEWALCLAAEYVDVDAMIKALDS